MSAPRWSVRDGGLQVEWTDGAALFAPARLREACRCASCRARVRDGLAVQADAGVALVALREVGAYGLQLSFSDGHERGIYPWPLLRALSEQ